MAISSTQKGFILPATLWLVAILGMVVGSVTVWATLTTSDVFKAKSRLDDEVAFHNAFNTVVYYLTTGHASSRGLEVGHSDTTGRADFLAMAGAETDAYLRLDFTPYQFVDDGRTVSVRFQDNRGLVNLSGMTDAYLRRFLGVFDVPVVEQSQLASAMLDYVDSDDLARLSGAERADYRKMGLPDPINAPFTTPDEIMWVMGWDGLDDMWKVNNDRPLFALKSSGLFNPNTAPPELLYMLGGVSPDTVGQIDEHRRRTPFRSVAELSAIVPSSRQLSPMELSLLPGNGVTIELESPETGRRQRLLIVPAPAAVEVPWQVLYKTDVAVREPNDKKPESSGIVLPEPHEIYTD